MRRSWAVAVLVLAFVGARCGEPGRVIAHPDAEEAFRQAVRTALPIGTPVRTFEASMAASHFHCERSPMSGVGPHFLCKHCELQENETVRAMWQVVAFDQNGSISRLDADHWKYPLAALRDVCE